MQWVTLNKTPLLRAFRLFYAMILLNVVLGGVVFMVEPLTYYTLFFSLARKLGTLAALAYSTTLWPSILQRFRVFPRTAGLGAAWRRQIGVSMFLLAWAHMMLMRTIPLGLTSPSSLFQANSQVLFGLTAWMLLFPLWLTSNDPAKHFLGKWWKRLHRATYIALVFIMLHVALAESSVLAVLVVTFAAEVASWLVWWGRPRNEPGANTTVSSPTVAGA